MNNQEQVPSEAFIRVKEINKEVSNFFSEGLIKIFKGEKLSLEMFEKFEKFEQEFIIFSAPKKQEIKTLIEQFLPHEKNNFQLELEGFEGVLESKNIKEVGTKIIIVVMNEMLKLKN